MKLYFIPLACSLAVRTALTEAGLAADYIQVKPTDHSLPDGTDFREVHPLGQVPVLALDDGTVLTEAPAILQYIADLVPEAGLAPKAGTRGRTELQQWLNVVGTELHKLVFGPLLNKKAPAEARAWAQEMARPRFDYLSDHLSSRPYLLGESFSVADAYLLAVLNWCEHAGIALSDWPALNAYRSRLRQRPSIAAAMQAELPLLKAA